MNISHRIILMVVLTFVALSSISGYAILQARSNASEVKQVTEGVVPSALAAADLVSTLKQVQLTVMAVVSAPDQNLAELASEKLKQQQDLLRQGLDRQARETSSDAQRGLVEQARDSLANYFSAVDDTIRFKLAGQDTLAAATLSANVAAYQKEFEQIVETLRVEKNRSKDEAIATLNANLASALTTISLIAWAAILVSALIGFLLYRQVVVPIRNMQAKMSEIATTQDFSHRLPVARSDEIGLSIGAFNTMIGKIQESSSQLRQKTNDIQTMLQNMPQGILTIAAGSRVHPEYSAYLETIFETSEISGRDIMELVFSDTGTGADLLAQVDAAVAACLGEDVMNFEFNAHLLIGEIEKRMPDGRVKVLDLSWSPITDETGTTVRLLLCVRDITELRRLAAEANEQKRELEIIGEILAVSQEKFFEFVSSASRFIDDNEALLRAHPQHDTETLTLLFRNMHTIKGNARTYGLRYLTNIVHETEQSYDELRKERPGIAWDQEQLLTELGNVRKAVERYARINEVSLGRKGPGRRGNVDRYVLVDRAQIQATIRRLENVNTANLHELVAARDAVHKVLRLLGTETIGQTLSGVFDSLPNLARELGKIAPMVVIEDHHYVIRNQASGLLKNVFMHLVRNAMDHGIETPDERNAAGKSLAGTITLRLAIADSCLKLSLQDDGRGLALARIRATGIARGLIEAQGSYSDEEIARLIFRPGFSTAERVTEVSGRGVGMDAVQDFIKREKGSIDIAFIGDDQGQSFRQFVTIVSLPEAFAEFVDEGARATLQDADDEVVKLEAATLQATLAAV
jgi:two-component system, chemotaxis family, sensor kinase CheA